ncbi:hypothetical protein AYL99_12132 [Fonsecaea erecta]|uniref:Uncharacterized protein n=1 Tax=Fonsecaea erecta TaxID=1367422 RepID=A0A178Z1L7_9EURO|nr:hypothetical protein AYL99_12132 [Fonsecaea erecta]OAP53699.1 hypothetical protein AYL99_12132 [Fonsecaea erecta]
MAHESRSGIGARVSALAKEAALKLKGKTGTTSEYSSIVAVWKNPSGVATSLTKSFSGYADLTIAFQVFGGRPIRYLLLFFLILPSLNSPDLAGWIILSFILLVYRANGNQRQRPDSVQPRKLVETSARAPRRRKEIYHSRFLSSLAVIRESRVLRTMDVEALWRRPSVTNSVEEPAMSGRGYR